MVDEASNADQAKPLMVGERLQHAREAMQLNVTDVADALHITPTYVNLIEKNQFHKLPGAIFARGYIKSYARLVNLPVVEIMALYFEQTGDAPMESRVRPAVNEYGVSVRRHAVKWALGIILAVLLLPTLVWWYAHQDDVEAVVTTSTQTIVPATTSTVETEATRSNDSADADVKTDEPAALENSTSNMNMATANKEKRISEITPTPSSPVANIKTASDTLQIKFTGKCWIQVKNIDGVILHDAEHQAGENITIGGKSPLYVWVKNAKAVTILFNDKPVKIDNQDSKGTARLVVGK